MRAFAAMPPVKQMRQLEDWAARGTGPAVIAGQLAESTRLRTAADLDDIIATLLDNDEWQGLMSTPPSFAMNRASSPPR